MAIRLGLNKDELYDQLLYLCKYGNFYEYNLNNHLATLDFYLERYTNIYPKLFDEYRFNKLIFYLYDGQTNNKSMNFIEPIKIFLKYGADINKIDPHMSKYYYTTIFTEIVKQMIIHIQSQEYRDEENSDEEVFNLLKLFVYTGIDENLGNPSFNDYIDYYYEIAQIVREYGYQKFLKLYDMAKNDKMLFHTKQRSSFAKASLLPQNVLDSVFEHLDYDIPIELGKRLYDNTNMLSNLDTFHRFNPNETYQTFINKKNESIRDSLRDISMRPSTRKFAKRTIKNRKRHKRKY